MSEPKCIEVDISATAGGKVQIVQFKLSNDFTFSYSEKYTIPTDWEAQQFEEWKTRKAEEIKTKVDEFAQTEQDALLASSDWYSN